MVMVTLTKEEANFVFNLIMLVGNAYPKLKDDGDFMAVAKVVTDKVFNAGGEDEQNV